ncbi:hypothetical protein [Undibacterium sp. CY21W]|uniref:hypothetical protein n=1 Tax=Undibacterium sp. CY21W TaxID=2762293 RepID=UPI00164B4D54|nr:hypothetical protein [Undibacterium sp. CY21W]MBC3926631.1 hypothetical protein [Undibacterium sp. CY21W]
MVNMTPVRFYRLSLLAPILLPLPFLPFGIGTLLLFTLGFGGVQYAIFAAILYIAIGRLKSAESIQRLARWVPVLFIPFQAAGWLINCYFERLSNPALIGNWDPLLPFAAYILVVGYGYVGLVALTYHFAKSAGYIENNEP